MIKMINITIQIISNSLVSRGSDLKKLVRADSLSLVNSIVECSDLKKLVRVDSFLLLQLLVIKSYYLVKKIVITNLRNRDYRYFFYFYFRSGGVSF